MATDNGIIYRYDFEKKQFLRKEFSEFRNKCFFDLIILKNEQIVVCGGAKGISKGEKIILHVKKNGPMVVEQEEDKAYRYVVTPMRGR